MSHEFAAGASWAGSLMPLKSYSVEELMHVKFVVAQSPPVGFVGKFGERSGNSLVSSSSLDRHSSLRGPSPIGLMLLRSATLKK
ncbi:hypothetical protein TNCV_4109071 [Trichonephila clavipes]|nr:hypothetical protein TNCV_4109071 [Trichonephila clavipes]